MIFRCVWHGTSKVRTDAKQHSRNGISRKALFLWGFRVARRTNALFCRAKRMCIVLLHGSSPRWHALCLSFELRKARQTFFSGPVRRPSLPFPCEVTR
jgi:hypothetical protein